MNNNIDNETRARAEQWLKDQKRPVRLGSEAFHKAMQHVIKWEGGYVNDPVDPGGETKYGISKRSYPNLNIAKLTLEDAFSIYYTDFWRPFRLDNLPFDIAVSIFDAAINVGPTRTRSWIRELANENGYPSAAAFNDRREKYYEDLVKARPELKRFEKGWENRLNSLRSFIDLG